MEEAEARLDAIGSELADGSGGAGGGETSTEASAEEAAALIDEVDGLAAEWLWNSSLFSDDDDGGGGGGGGGDDDDAECAAGAGAVAVRGGDVAMALRRGCAAESLAAGEVDVSAGVSVVLPGGVAEAAGVEEDASAALVLVAFSGGAADTCVAAATRDAADGDPPLVSAVVEMSVQLEGGAGAAVAADALAAPIEVTFPLNSSIGGGARRRLQAFADVENVGGGACDRPPLFLPGDPARTCLAGCCLNEASVAATTAEPLPEPSADDGTGPSTCTCADPLANAVEGAVYRGALCDHELVCESAATEGDGWSSEACGTAVVLMDPTGGGGGEAVVCSCRKVGMVAVFLHRVRPETSLKIVDDWASFIATRTWRTPLTVAMCALGYLLVLYVAWRFDRATVYQSRPPAWLRASVGKCQLLRDLLLTLRLRSVVLRIVYVCPGYTMYSRTQLLHVLALSMVANAAAVVVFLEQTQCTFEKAIVSGSLSALASSFITIVARTLFKWANGVGEYRAFFKHHKKVRLARRVDIAIHVSNPLPPLREATRRKASKRPGGYRRAGPPPRVSTAATSWR